MSKITVYHGCNLKYVNDIKSEIAFSFSKPKPKKPEDGDEPEDPSLFASRWGGKQYPSDFTAKSEGRGFYTTKDAGYAQWWAEEVAKKNTKILAAAVIEFELDLKDLRVFDFGTSEQGPTYEKWQQVRHRCALFQTTRLADGRACSLFSITMTAKIPITVE